MCIEFVKPENSDCYSTIINLGGNCILYASALAVANVALTALGVDLSAITISLPVAVGLAALLSIAVGLYCAYRAMDITAAALGNFVIEPFIIK